MTFSFYFRLLLHESTLPRKADEIIKPHTALSLNDFRLSIVNPLGTNIIH